MKRSIGTNEEIIQYFLSLRDKYRNYEKEKEEKKLISENSSISINENVYNYNMKLNVSVR